MRGERGEGGEREGGERGEGGEREGGEREGGEREGGEREGKGSDHGDWDFTESSRKFVSSDQPQLRGWKQRSGTKP